MLYKIALRQKMEEALSLHTMLHTVCKEIKEDWVIVKDIGNTESFIKADTVIIATGLRADKGVAESFYGIVPETYRIGDCIKPRKIMEATTEGYTLAANL